MFSYILEDVVRTMNSDPIKSISNILSRHKLLIVFICTYKIFSLLGLVMSNQVNSLDLAWTYLRVED